VVTLIVPWPPPPPTDWLNTPEDALVTPKDPMAFARRLEFYADPANHGIFGA
jgi:homoserine kinase type II